MIITENLYNVLGVDTAASDDEIKLAYRKLAKIYHPDRNKTEEGKEMIIKINLAYTILSDNHKRELYDKYGEKSLDPNFRYSSDYEHKVPVFHPVKGKDIFQELEIPFRDSVFGCKRIISYTKHLKCESCSGTGSLSEPIQCNTCNGTGEIRYSKKTASGNTDAIKECNVCNGLGFLSDHKCPDCSGTGSIKKIRKANISIPAGIDSGRCLRFTGGGELGKRGGENGDLMIRVKITPHPIYKRNGNDIYIDWNISIADAILGNSIRIPTLYGVVEYPLAEGTQHLSKIKLRNKGIQSLKGNSYGHQYVTLHIQIPKRITKEQRQHIEACDFKAENPEL